MEERRRKHWGWGYEDEQPAEQVRATPGGSPGIWSSGGRGRGAGRARGGHAGGPADRAARRAGGDLRGDTHARASHALGSPTSTSCAASAAASSIHPTSSAGPRDEIELERCSSGARRSAWRRSPSAAGPASWAGSRPMSAALQRRRLGRPRGARPRARGGRGLARRADPGGGHGPGAGGPARRARPDPAPLPAVVRATRRSAAGSRRARRATSRPSGPTSRTSSSRCARSPRRGCGSRAGCPARARGSAPTGCSPARRARWG